MGASTTGHFRFDNPNPAFCADFVGTGAPAATGSDASLGNGNANVPYSLAITGLTPVTQYWFCAIATNATGTAYATLLSFTTPAALPVVTTTGATGSGSPALTLNGSATPGGAATTVWFRYGTMSPGTCNDTFGTRLPGSGGTALGSGNVPVAWSTAPPILTLGVTYYYCAIASNSAGTGFGTVSSFTISAPPGVTTNAASSVTSASATLNGSVNPNFAATTAWYRYASVQPPLCDDSFGTRAPAFPPNDVSLGNGSSAVPYTQNVTGLASATTYWFCSIAVNASGTSFGNIMSFTTPATAPAVTNDQFDALTDGLLILRYMFGYTGTALTSGALANNAVRTDPAQIVLYLDGVRTYLDIDGNNTVDPLTDGLLIIRDLLGRTGDALITGAIGPGAVRSTAATVQPYLTTLTQ